LPNRDASICLLDDDPSVLKGLSRLLTSAGWRAEQFSDPDKFLLYARTHRTPVAVMGIWMPLMNGLEVQS
jgi:FixJ family two-component response regulator